MSLENREKGLNERQYIMKLMDQAHDFEEDVREDALRKLQIIDVFHLKVILLSILDDQGEDVTGRADAADMMMRFYSDQGLDAIKRHLSDPDDVLRWSLCHTIGEFADIGDRRAIDALTQILGSDNDGDIRLQAARILGLIGDMRALPALRHAQDHDLGTGREGHKVATFAAGAIQCILARESEVSTDR